MQIRVEDRLKKLRYSVRRGTYTVEESVKDAAQRHQMDPAEMAKLNFNENLFVPREKLTEYLKEIANEFDPRLYPQDEEIEFKKRFADYLNVPQESLVVGNGSDELVVRVAQILVRKGTQVILTTPTFPFYRHSISLLGAKYVEVPLKRDFSLDTEQILTETSTKTKLLFICSPNNPTANQFSLKQVNRLLENFPGVVVIDEAYAEYGEYSTVSSLNKYENLVILRTFSKAFGLAGLRLGCAVTSPSLAELLSMKSAIVFPVSGLALRMGLTMLKHFDIVNEAVNSLKAERRTLIDELNRIGKVKAFESQTNFVLFQVEKESRTVREDLIKRGVLIKNLGRVLHLDNCLRATVGLRQMNMKMLDVLGECIKK